MIDRQFGFLMMICEDCGVTFPEVGQYDVEDDFDKFIKDSREAGWVHTREEHVDFEHRCAECGDFEKKIH